MAKGPVHHKVSICNSATVGWMTLYCPLSLHRGEGILREKVIFRKHFSWPEFQSAKSAFARKVPV